MKFKPKKTFINSLKILTSLVIIYFVVKSGAFQIDRIEDLFSVKIFLTGIFCVLGSTIFLNERWRTLLAAQGIKLTLKESMELTLIGSFFNFLMPGGVGGDVIRGFYISKVNPESRLLSSLSVFMDRLLGLWAMIFIPVMTSVFFGDKFVGQELVYFRNFLFFVFIVFSGGLLLLFSKYLVSDSSKAVILKIPHGNKLWKLFYGVHSFGADIKKIVKVFFLSLAAQLFTLLFFILLAIELNLDLPYEVHFLAVPLGFIATAIPISPGGVGVGQAAFHFLYSTFSQGVVFGALAISALQIFQFLFSLIGAILFLRKKDSLKEVESAI